MSEMQLVQLFLPLRDNEGKAFPKALFDSVRDRLTAQFGGVTAFVHSPAVGLWEDGDGEVKRDDIVLFEVMTDAVDLAWWSHYRTRLAAQFRQDEIMVRSLAVRRL